MSAPPRSSSCALVLTGGGARAAYQVGVLRGLAARFPDLRFDVVTGVSAGAINAAFLASRSGPLPEVVDALTEVWRTLHLKDVVRIDSNFLLGNFLTWGMKLVSGGTPVAPRVRGLMDTTPLRKLVERLFPADADGEIAGLKANLAAGQPRAVSVTTLDYTTGQTVAWVSGSGIAGWERPLRRGVQAALTVEHVLASAALPILFPAVRLGRHFHGDGGIRLSAPLSPALHMGAGKILAVSTHYQKSFAEADEPQIAGYPPPAQILGQLVDAVFLDVMDEDAVRLERSNAFLDALPEEHRRGFRVVDMELIRPSRDLGRLASKLEPELPRVFRFLTRSLGTRETIEGDFLSLLLFVPEYMKRLIELGEADVAARAEKLQAFLAPAKDGRESAA